MLAPAPNSLIAKRALGKSARVLSSHAANSEAFPWYHPKYRLNATTSVCQFFGSALSWLEAYVESRDGSSSRTVRASSAITPSAAGPLVSLPTPQKHIAGWLKFCRTSSRICCLAFSRNSGEASASLTNGISAQATMPERSHREYHVSDCW